MCCQVAAQDRSRSRASENHMRNSHSAVLTHGGVQPLEANEGHPFKLRKRHQTYCSFYCRMIPVTGTPRIAKPEGSPSILYADVMVLTVGLVRTKGGIAPG